MEHTLLYLHGAGNFEPDTSWMSKVKIPPGTDIVVPNYQDLLELEPSGKTFDHYPRHDTQGLHHYHTQQTKVKTQLNNQETHSLYKYLPDKLDHFGEKIAVRTVLKKIRNYTHCPDTVSLVRSRVLDSLMIHPQLLVVVAHSLGSLVALDLVQHLPEGIYVNLLLTVAPAASRQNLSGHLKHMKYNYPYSKVFSWVNVYNTRDVICKAQGVNYHWPQSVDYPIKGRLFDHSLSSHLTGPVVGLIEDGLKDS